MKLLADHGSTDQPKVRAKFKKKTIYLLACPNALQMRPLLQVDALNRSRGCEGRLIIERLPRNIRKIYKSMMLYLIYTQHTHC